jgi:peptide/nickel transport system substrate-binding protein/oligopeptide transport system substrate-binding protein
VPLGNEPASLDPARITDIYSVNVAMNLFDGLVEYDKDLNVVPAIARHWVISPDRRSYTFYLRSGVKFHNGREVTAEDFAYSLQRILNPETKSPVAPLFFHISGAKAFHEGKSSTVPGLHASDALTLTIELEEPFAPFLSILAMANAKVVPKEAVGADFSRRPVGTGPFRVESWEPGQKIVLSANTDYFLGRPRLNTLSFRIYVNDPWEEIFRDFENGQLEQAVIPRSRYDEIIALDRPAQKYQLLSSPGLNLVYVGMNQTVAPFQDVRVRQAITHAVDIDTIVREVTRRGSLPARGILPPGIAGSDPAFRGFPYDPERARQLLAAAGYAEGRGFPPVEVWTVSRDESVQRELMAYQKYLAAVGIQLTPHVAENWKDFIQHINEKKVPMFYAAWYADYPDADNFLYVLCHSKSATNRMGYRNPQVDGLLEEARREMDELKRAASYREIQNLVMQEAPIVCQHVNSHYILLQPNVKDVTLSYLGPAYIPFRQVSIEPGEPQGAAAKP